jgi:glycosyltransferase involved in cell wall biosynthesis
VEADFGRDLRRGDVMLVIITTHPIQYQVPIWQALSERTTIPFQVWFLTAHGVAPSRDRQFGQTFSWDINLTTGYPYRFLSTPRGATPNSFWSCRTSGSMRKLLRDVNASVVWIQGWNVVGYWQAAFAAKRAGAEVWLRGETNDLAQRAGWKSIARSILLRQLFRRVDHFLYIGSANRRLYQKFGVAERQLHPAPYAVDNERFARQAEAIRSQRPEIRKQWNIPEDAFCVLFCGKFIPKKRPVDLVRAAQLLLSNNSPTNDRSLNIHLLYVGSGELGAELRANCNVVYDAENPFQPHDKELLTNNENPNASFAGFLNQTEVSRGYVAADVLVLPSDYQETWGLVVNEAMASGLSCIISDRCGCAEDLGRVAPNDVYSMGDITALAACIANLIQSSPHVASPEWKQTYSIQRTVDAVKSVWSHSRRL